MRAQPPAEEADEPGAGGEEGGVREQEPGERCGSPRDLPDDDRVRAVRVHVPDRPQRASSSGRRAPSGRRGRRSTQSASRASLDGDPRQQRRERPEVDQPVVRLQVVAVVLRDRCRSSPQTRSRTQARKFTSGSPAAPPGAVLVRAPEALVAMRGGGRVLDRPRVDDEPGERDRRREQRDRERVRSRAARAGRRRAPPRRATGIQRTKKRIFRATGADDTRPVTRRRGD